MVQHWLLSPCQLINVAITHCSVPSLIWDYPAMLHLLSRTLEREWLGGPVKSEHIHWGLPPPASKLWPKEEPSHGSVVMTELFGEPEEGEDIEEQPGSWVFHCGCDVQWFGNYFCPFLKYLPSPQTYDFNFQSQQTQSSASVILMNGFSGLLNLRFFKDFEEINAHIP